MRALYATAAISLGFWVLVAACLLASTPWLGIGLLAMACGAVDLMHMVGISFRRLAGDALECLAWFAMWLVLSAADLLRPKQGD